MTTDEKRAAFLDELRKSGNATDAAKAAGVSRTCAYQWRSDPAFAKRWDVIVEYTTQLSPSAPLAAAKVVALRDKHGAVMLTEDLEPILALDVSSVDPREVARAIGRPLHR